MQGSRYNEREGNSQESCIKCKHCGKGIISTNYLIHEARCGLKSSRIVQPSSQEKRQAPEVKPAQNYFNKPNPFRPEQKKSQVGQRQEVSSVNLRERPRLVEKKKEEQSITETIPCHFCGYQQTFEELDTHPQLCEHREQQCPSCNQMFPMSLMEEHLDLCENREPEEYQHPHHHHGHNHYGEQFNLFGNLNNLFGLRPPVPQERNPFGSGMIVVESQDANGNISRRILPSPSGNQGSMFSPFTHFIALLQRHAQRHGQRNQGLQKEEIKALKKITYKGNNELKQKNEKDLCTICYCEFEKDEKLIELKCKHCYHEECIVKWVENTAKCPVCKARLTERPIFEEEDEEENF